MAKKRRPKTAKGKDGGPYLQMALFCERVLREEDGVPTIVRVVDQINIRPIESHSEQPIRGFTSLIALVGFKRGDARKDRHRLRIVATGPDGKTGLDKTIDLVFPQKHTTSGATAEAHLQLQITAEGTYWFDISLNEMLYTRMPFRVLFLQGDQKKSNEQPESKQS